MKNIIIGILIVLLVASGFMAYTYYGKYDQLSDILRADYYTDLSVINQASHKGVNYLHQDGRWWIHVDDAMNLIDQDMYISGSGQRVYIPFEHTALKLETRELNDFVSTYAKSINLPLMEKDNRKWLDLELLGKVYGFTHQVYVETGVHQIWTIEQDVPVVQVTKNAKMLSAKSGPSLGLGQVPSGTMAIELYAENDASYILTGTGDLGWVESSKVTKRDSTQGQVQPLRSLRRGKDIPEPLHLAWQQVSTFAGNPDLVKTPLEEGINILSPTWFNLNVDGIVLNLADPQVVDKLHQAEAKVWPIFKNNFDPDWTQELLASPDLQNRVIAQLLVYNALYDIDGINFDFENMYLADKEGYASFVQKASHLLDQQQMVSSVDVTVPWGSDMWSKVYDRPALAQAVDFVMLMAYDEYWASSQKTGSVASEPWVRRGIEESLDLIPREKLILGFPFYARVWTTQSSGKVSSKAVGFNTQQKILKENNLQASFDPNTGQNFVVYTLGGEKKEIWLEDETSVRMRAKLVKEYDLPGLAAWSRSFGHQEVWNWIQSELE